MMFQDGLINTDSASLTVDAETYDCLVERFITRVTNTPDAIAAQRHGAELTNQELGHNASAIASLLKQSGIQADSVVGVFAYPGFELLSAVWGVLLSGSAYCPLSPDYPEDRIRYMIEQSGMQVIVCEESLKSTLAEICSTRVTVLTLSEARLLVTGHLGAFFPAL